MKAISKKSEAPAFHILSYIRVRPLNEKEKKTHHLEFSRKDVIVKNNNSKILSFDKVFDEDSKQVSVYSTVVHPMIREVLQGYNCTVFAYGQTGTGKTYTMTGQQASADGPITDNLHAGIIPRAMEEIFKELSMLRSEYHVSVQYIELYNEKLRSLLTDANEENIQLINDLEGGVFLKGIPPTPVKNKDEAFKLLLQGGERRQMASTSLNENSSRSHTIFIIIVKMRESIPSEKEDILRVGKLYLVDLAGSENVSKSGANDLVHKTSSGVNKRLAEASNINKSLLTLGRVITALTENSSHIPYRESKLTRILGDSLGGKTKTAIIATVSPSHANIDETESTLNYACKARSIKNKPEKNQTISKKEFMQFASEEILKLKKDLEATRQGDGFYITKESHEEMCNNMKCLEIQVKDWNDRYERLNLSYNEKSSMFESLSTDYDEKCAEYEELDQIFKLESTKFKERLKEVEKEITVREFLIKEFEKTESKLTEQAKTCKSLIENLADQSGKLHDKIDRIMINESNNSKILDSFKLSLKKELKTNEANLGELHDKEIELASYLSNFAAKTMDKVHEETELLFTKFAEFQEKVIKQNCYCENAQRNLNSTLEKELNDHREMLQERSAAQITVLESLVADAIRPAFDEVSEHVLSLKTLMAKISTDFNEVKNKQGDLVKRAKVVEENWKSVSKGILDDFLKLKEIIEDSLNKAKEKTELDKSIIQKTLKTIELMQEIRFLQEYSCQSSLENENNLKSCYEQSVQLETVLNKSTENISQENAVAFNSVLKLLDENDELQQQMFTEALPKIEGFTAQKEITLQSVLSAVDDKIATLKETNVKVDTDCANLSHSLISQTNELINEVQSSIQLSSTFVNSIKREVNENKENMTSSIRCHYGDTLSYATKVKENTSKMGKSLTNLESMVETFNYNPYVPLGQTPQRVTRKELNYPEKFISTASRDILMQKFRLQENESSDLSNIEASEYERSPLQPSKNVNQMMRPSQKNHTPKLRRSLSVNDLSEVINEDKENRKVTLSAKRQGKKKELLGWK